MRTLIDKYFPGLTEEQRQQFGRLQELYADWNRKINVISRKDIELLYERHVLHSLGIAKVISFSAGTRVLDVGTGGGFPGIPLAIMFPEVTFVLVDSIGKKIRVVNEIAASLGLRNVQARQQRAEEVKEKFHFVVSRAVTEFPVFLKWVKGKIAADQINTLRNGILYLKGGDLKAELGPLFMRATLYDLSACFEEEFFETKKVLYYPLT